MSFLENNLRDLKHTQIIKTKEILDEIDINKKLYPKIKFGSKSIDIALNGGFYPKTSYVVFGANMTGKTQICHQLTIQAYAKSQKSIFIDTENTFRPERINELAIIHNYDGEDVLKSIFVSKIMSNMALELKLSELDQIIKKNNIQLLIIDSINNYFRFEIGAKQTSSNIIRAKFYKILELINKLTIKYDLITIMTAQVTPNFSLESIIKEIPVGLAYLNHFFSEFIYLSYKEVSIGSIHYINSSRFPEKKVQYRITKNGIEDYKI